MKSDITYDNQYQNSTMDIISPNVNSDYCPVILYVHGGGYIGGDKTDNEAYLKYIAAQGFVVVNINYALAPDSKYPTPVLQLSQAYNYIESHHDIYGADMNRVIVAGDSAGAQIALQFVNIQVNDGYAGRVSIKPVVSRDSICGAVSLSGLLDLSRYDETEDAAQNSNFARTAEEYFGDLDWKASSAVRLASIVGNTNAAFPPTFITDGNTNSFEDQARSLEAELMSQRVSVTSVFYPKSDAKLHHEFQFDTSTPQGKDVRNRLLKFLHEVSQTNSSAHNLDHNIATW